MNQIPLVCEKRVEPPPPEITEIHEEATTMQLVDDMLGETNAPPVTVDEIETTTAELVSLHKFPKIKWHQTKSKVVVTVHAPDVQNYSLKVNTRLLQIRWDRRTDLTSKLSKREKNEIYRKSEVN